MIIIFTKTTSMKAHVLQVRGQQSKPKVAADDKPCHKAIPDCIFYQRVDECVSPSNSN
jgi:hypothetical protein